MSWNDSYLFVKLDVSRLELLSNLSATSKVVRVLSVRERFARFSLVGSEVLCRRLGDSVQRYGNILVISNFLQMDVRNLIVLDFSRVVVDDVSRKLGEVGCH